MNQFGSYFEINKENIFHKGKSNCRNESCLDPNRIPLRDITHLYNKSNNNPEYEEKASFKFTSEIKCAGSNNLKTKIVPSKLIR